MGKTLKLRASERWAFRSKAANSIRLLLPMDSPRYFNADALYGYQYPLNRLSGDSSQAPLRG
ncbi:MAG: hypothetical protein ACXADX_13930 [Candidatus Hodarchaeales archaeon]